MKKSKLLKVSLAIVLIISCLLFTVTAYGQENLTVTYDKIKVFLQGGARQVLDITDTLRDANGNQVEAYIKDGTTYLPARAISEALGLNVNWDSAEKSVTISGFAPYYRSAALDYDVVPVTMSMQAGYNELQQYTSGKTIHSGEGYIDPFGVGTYTAGINYNEAAKFPIDQYFSAWWMQNFSTGLFCIYQMKDGNIYAWDGILGRVDTDLGDGTTNQEDALVNIIVGGTGAYEGVTGILVGHTPSSGDRAVKEDGSTGLPQALFKLMEGYIKIPKDASKVTSPAVTQTIGEYEKLSRTDTTVYKTFPIDMTMKAGSHEWNNWTSGFWTIHSGIGLMEPFGQGSYHAGMGYTEAADIPATNFFNENWQNEFGTDLFCIYHCGDLGDIYVYDGLWTKMLQEEKDTGGKVGTLAQRQDALINVIVGGTGAFEGATGILVGKTMGAGEYQQCGFMPEEIVKVADTVPYTLPETLLKIMSGYIRVPADSAAASYADLEALR